eukprot:TRINITY_DN64667_c0_g1_i1.p1 TRINITY_DN64667_c0_g1~~TRINITY_DN64667_c0_g1_i1.p1  ORF type:complete len:506 (-),score=75.73 TRINITY_DN64667_c0_g1_i1:20-1537(-)
MRYLDGGERVDRGTPLGIAATGAYVASPTANGGGGVTAAVAGFREALGGCGAKPSVTGLTGSLVAGKFKVGRKIGSGSFGEIHVGTNIASGEEVAIKLESHRSRHPQLVYEAKLYRLLAGGGGLPNVIWYGTEGSYNVMVLDLLGPSLEDLFNVCNRRFSLKTTLMLADQMINRIEYVHTHDIIHRDIKPDNFLVGVGSEASNVYIIDFGLAKRYRDPRTRQHIPYREHKNLTGTARYASVNTHLGVEQSRRDDLEAIGYVLMYFLRGSLPWQGLKATSKRDKYEKISRSKVETSPAMLCANYPPEFATYLNYCRALRFEDRPDYNHLRNMFRSVFLRSGFRQDFCFDWISPSESPQRRISAKAPLWGSGNDDLLAAREARVDVAAGEATPTPTRTTKLGLTESSPKTTRLGLSSPKTLQHGCLSPKTSRMSPTHLLSRQAEAAPRFPAPSARLAEPRARLGSDGSALLQADLPPKLATGNPHMTTRVSLGPGDLGPRPTRAVGK